MILSLDRCALFFFSSSNISRVVQTFAASFSLSNESSWPPAEKIRPSGVSRYKCCRRRCRSWIFDTSTSKQRDVPLAPSTPSRLSDEMQLRFWQTLFPAVHRWTGGDYIAAPSWTTWWRRVSLLIPHLLNENVYLFLSSVVVLSIRMKFYLITSHRRRRNKSEKKRRNKKRGWWRITGGPDGSRSVGSAYPAAVPVNKKPAERRQQQQKINNNHQSGILFFLSVPIAIRVGATNF